MAVKLLWKRGSAPSEETRHGPISANYHLGGHTTAAHSTVETASPLRWDQEESQCSPGRALLAVVGYMLPL